MKKRRGFRPVAVILDEVKTPIDELREFMEVMQASYDHTREQLMKTISATYQQQGIVPEDMLDGNGRPILLDSMLKLLEAKMVLARHWSEEQR